MKQEMKDVSNMTVRGVSLGLLRTVAILSVSVLAVSYAAGTFFPRPYDDTDADGQRSGMALYTDAGTGCQYLSVHRTGLTPRLDADGRHVCAR